MAKLEKTLFIFTFLCFSLKSFAGDRPVTFGSFPIPLMVVNSEEGVFVDLVKEIKKRLNLSGEIIISPAARSVNSFLAGKVDVFFPALDASFPEGSKFVRSRELIYTKEDFVFTRKGKPLLRTLKNLEGVSVGITLGYPYSKKLMQNKLMEFERAKTDENNVQRLIKGRINAFVVEEKSGIQAFKNTNEIDKMQYDPNTPISRQDVYFAFQKTKRGMALAKKFSITLVEMKKDGSFSRILSRAKSSK